MLFFVFAIFMAIAMWIRVCASANSLLLRTSLLVGFPETHLRDRHCSVVFRIRCRDVERCTANRENSTGFTGAVGRQRCW